MPELARRVGVEVTRLWNYDAQSNPVPYWIGSRIAEVTDHCQRWLATGRLPRHPFLPVEAWVDAVIPQRFTFSGGFCVIAHDCDDLIKMAADGMNVAEADLAPEAFVSMPSIGASPMDSLRTAVKRRLHLVGILLDRLPLLQIEARSEEIDALFERCASDASKFEKSAAIEYDLVRDELHAEFEHRVSTVSQSTFGTFVVDETSAKRKYAEVPCDLYEHLIERAKRVCQARGAKSALADALSVPNSRVSEWLSGAGAPTAAKTLELLAWVEAAEGKTKRPDRATTRTGQKTRQKTQASDKPSSPKRKT